MYKIFRALINIVWVLDILKEAERNPISFSWWDEWGNNKIIKSYNT